MVGDEGLIRTEEAEAHYIFAPRDFTRPSARLFFRRRDDG